VLDPRTGVPVLRHSAWVIGPESYLCDALSTALLVNGPDWDEEMRSRWKEYRGECT
jgi:thiamine biosynthesis lipoprotein ApbE